MEASTSHAILCRMPESVTVHVELLDEGVEVWRPVAAVKVGEGTYRLEDQAPGGERWAFPPGSIVRCEERLLTEGGDPGPSLVAFAIAD
jgi:hypothetical protein